MAQDWYYKLLGDETGPVSFATLRELVGEGVLTLDDEVRTSTSSWKRAEQVLELFSAGEVHEPELASDFDLDLLLAPSTPQPVKVSAKRQGQRAAIAAAAAPVAEWYYKVLDQEMGPATADEIIQQIKEGSLQGSDLVCLGEHGIFQTLEETPEFSAVVLEMRPKPEWYCRVLGQEFGPMMIEELQQMTKAGAFNAGDEVRHGDSAPWVKADRVRGLKFPKSSLAGVTPAHDKNSTLVPFGEAAKKREWYYEIIGQQMGPISFNEMAKAVADGTLKVEDKARRGKTGAWLLVLDVPGLISSDVKAAYLAAKLEARRPKPPAPSPVVVAALAAKPPEVQQPTPSAASGPAIPERSPASSPAAVPSNSSAEAASAYGSMAPASRASVPQRPPFKPPAKSKGSSSNVGDLLGKLDMKIVGAIGGVLLLVGLYFVIPMLGISFGPQPGLPEYEKVKALWTEVQTLHKNKAKPAEWATFKKEHETEIKNLNKQIQDQGPSSKHKLLLLMSQCTKNHLPKIMAGGTDLETRYKAMEKAMKEADVEVKGK